MGGRKTSLSFAQHAFMFKQHTFIPLLAHSLTRTYSLFSRSLNSLSIYLSFSRFLNPIVRFSCEYVLVPLVNLLFSFIVFHFIVTPVVWQNTRFKHATFDTHTHSNIVFLFYYYHYYYCCCSLMIELNFTIFTCKKFHFMFLSDGNKKTLNMKNGHRSFYCLLDSFGKELFTVFGIRNHFN